MSRNTYRSSPARLQPVFKTALGQAFAGDSLELLPRLVPPHSVDLIMTSPPYGLIRNKDYGHARCVPADQYVEWFRPFARLFKRLLKPTGSLVIDIGGSWVPGMPTRSLYHYELLVTLVRHEGFYLAQEFYWWNPSKLPTPAEWVTVRRIRVKDAVNCIWWLSSTPWPKASNRRVLQPYSSSMEDLLKKGYEARRRPSGHDISGNFIRNNRRSIPANLLAIANTESNSRYLRYCRLRGLPIHPSRFPSALPEFFIRMLTNRGDLVLDPFAGSCVTGEVSERMGRRWICVDVVAQYVEGARGRFLPTQRPKGKRPIYYRIPHADSLRGEEKDEDLLPDDGGRFAKEQRGRARVD
ncbi:MAG: site-specific DNA-methyltransferase [Chloroflexi bacterium]|nr:site-specific DNA-methyltransferase [Chloroflexota bacterium]